MKSDAESLAGHASHDDIERLASCVGLMLGEDGEAENAGRAVRNIARRLGLTGGQLKQMFLAGANASSFDEGGYAGASDADSEALHRRLTISELARQANEREIATLVTEKTAVSQALDDMAARTRRWRMAFGATATVFVLALGTLGVRSHPAQSLGSLTQSAPEATPFGRAAVVRTGGTTLFEAPDGPPAGSMPLPAGTRLVVRRLLWKTLQQWAEVELPGGGRSGYVITTAIEMS